MDAPIERHTTISFLTLPLEIRRQIYTYALQRGSIYFHKGPYGEEHPRPAYCVHSQREIRRKQFGNWEPEHKRCYDPRPRPRNLGDCPDSLSIGILYTCRQVHVEASQILWSKNTFHFEEPATFNAFLTQIGLSNRAALRSLSVRTGWAVNCDVPVPEDWAKAIAFFNLNSLLKDLRGLQALRLDIWFTFFHEQTIDQHSCKAAHDMLDALTSLPLETVEVNLMDPRVVCLEQSRHIYFKRIEDQLIKGFAPKPDDPSYRPPKIKTIWDDVPPEQSEHRCHSRN